MNATEHPSLPRESDDGAYFADRVAWLIRLRWIAVAGICAATGLAHALGLLENPAPSFAVAAILALLNALWWSFGDKATGTSESLDRFLFGQLVLDLVALAVLLHFTGGVENPFATFFAFHMALAAMLLPRRAGILLAVIAILLYTALGMGEFAGILPHHPTTVPQHVHGAGFAHVPAFVAGRLLAIGLMLAGVLHFVRSVVERQRRAETERHEHERVAMSRERLARVGEISAGVAHAVRNPLHGLINCVDILSAKPGADEPTRQTYALMAEALQRIESVTEQLLALTRDAPLHRIPSDVDALVRDSLLLVSPRGRGSAASIETELGEVGEADVDRLRLSEAIINVVDNACAACAGGGSVLVRTSCAPSADAPIVLEVHDTGTGIAPADLDKVFTPFFTTKAIGEGSGLGLAVTRRIIDEHGGKISLESTLGKGTRVKLSIPRRAQPDRPVSPSS